MSFSKKKIYLAGPITGLTYNDARHGWRADFAKLLKNRGAEHIECFSPMREKEFLENNQCIGGEAKYDSMDGFGTPQGILTRDHNDVYTCDMMVANFLGAKRVSIGTCAEFGFAHAHRKPVIAICEKSVEVVTEHKIVTEEFPAFWTPEQIGDHIKKKHGTDQLQVVSDVVDAMSGGDRILKIKVPGKVEIVKNIHDHVFLRAIAGYWVPSLDAAADIAQSILTPGL